MANATTYLKASIPVYSVTDGNSRGTYYLAGWAHFLLFLILLVNVFGWGIFGIFELVNKIA